VLEYVEDFWPIFEALTLRLRAGGVLLFSVNSISLARRFKQPMFRLMGVRDSVFEDFQIAVQRSSPLDTAVQLETQAGAAATNRKFTNIIVQGSGYLAEGFRWCTGDDCGDAGGNANNDIDTLIAVQVTGHSNAAYGIEASQSKNIVFLHSTCLGNETGERCVATTSSAANKYSAGSFIAIGMAGGNNSVADFDLGGPDDANAIYISGGGMEGSSRLLQTGGPGSSPWPISIIGCRWAANR
jgi:hypothetical protein